MTYSLDFDQHLPVSAQIGMQQAIDHADPRWIEAAKSCVFGEARCHQEITVDDVWLALERVNEQRKASGLPLFATHNGSAMGPIMKLCAGIDYIAPIHGKFSRSRIAHKNGNLHQVWRSNLYGGQQ